MATFFPAKRAVEFIFYISVRSQADSTIFQSSATIAAGDFKVSIDGGALANPATLPAVTPAASKLIKVTLSATEMTGDNILFLASDAAGAEWMDGMWAIQTAARQVDDLAFPVTSGRGIDVDASGGVEVGSFQTGAITAAAIAADAITDAKVASDVTIASVTGAVGSVTGAVGSVTGSVGSVTGSVGSVTGAVGSVTGAVGSVTGMTASDVGAIKAKTDSLTFTVAGKADANITHVIADPVKINSTKTTDWGGT